MQPQPQPPPPPVYTTEQLAALMTAYATGARVVKYGDKEITYNSPQELLQAIQNVRAGLGLNKPRRRRAPGYNKGLI